jgi:hypothetical protein
MPIIVCPECGNRLMAVNAMCACSEVAYPGVAVVLGAQGH